MSRYDFKPTYTMLGGAGRKYKYISVQYDRRPGWLYRVWLLCRHRVRVIDYKPEHEAMMREGRSFVNK